MVSGFYFEAVKVEGRSNIRGLCEVCVADCPQNSLDMYGLCVCTRLGFGGRGSETLRGNQSLWNIL